MFRREILGGVFSKNTLKKRKTSIKNALTSNTLKSSVRLDQGNSYIKNEKTKAKF